MNLLKPYLPAAVLIYLILSPTEAVTFEEDVTLTGQQRHILERFRQVVASRLPHDYMKKDIYLIKWLRARSFNIREAEEMLMKNLQWRREQRMDTIHLENWSDFFKDYTYFIESRDKEGKPVLYLDIGSHDVRKAVVTGKTEMYLRLVNKSFEDTFNLIRTLGEKYGNVTRAQVIANLDGFNLVQHGCFQCIPIVLRMMDSYLNHYPGFVDQFIFVNTPGIFEPLLNALKLVADPETRNSLKVYGRNKRMWMDILAKDFDFRELPPELGGTKIYSGTDDY